MLSDDDLHPFRRRSACWRLSQRSVLKILSQTQARTVRTMRRCLMRRSKVRDYCQSSRSLPLISHFEPAIINPLQLPNCSSCHTQGQMMISSAESCRRLAFPRQVRQAKFSSSCHHCHTLQMLLVEVKESPTLLQKNGPCSVEECLVMSL